MAGKKRDPLLRFANKYTKTDSGCWQWHGAPCGTNGEYGYFWTGERYIVAHRFAYLLQHGSIPTGMEIDHLCKNTKCVNPAHLEAVSHQENINRSAAGRNNAVKTHCPSGHPYDEANTVRYDNRRYCLACRVSRQAKKRSQQS